MARSTSLFALVSLSLVVNAATASELTVEPDKENVVASRLIGNWQPLESLTQRLTGKAPSGPTSIAFRSDPTVAGLIPERKAKFFEQRGMKVYLAGYVTVEGKAHPFALTQLHGNPRVLFWLERNGGDPFGNGESFNVMLAVANDKEKDLLFIGGDFNNQAFTALERADQPAKTEPEK